MNVNIAILKATLSADSSEDEKKTGESKQFDKGQLAELHAQRLSLNNLIQELEQCEIRLNTLSIHNTSESELAVECESLLELVKIKHQHDLRMQPILATVSFVAKVAPVVLNSYFDAARVERAYQNTPFPAAIHNVRIEGERLAPPPVVFKSRTSHPAFFNTTPQEKPQTAQSTLSRGTNHAQRR
ncbi:MAG: hypothetical protein NTZ67_03465 [Gammaproteobacteria bacterium]|nr:hypothetical protein [Gammaproteobacteria bacterium]